MPAPYALSAERNTRIDVLRGGFSLLILVGHCIDIQPDPGTIEDFIRGISTFAVPSFFAISAYLLLSSLNRRLETSTKPYLGFYLSRCFRIFPLWWLVCLWLFISGESLRVVLANAFWLMGFTSNPEYWPVEVAWSLFVEEVFYILFLILMPFFKWPMVMFSIVFAIGMRAFVFAQWKILDIPALHNDPNLTVSANLLYFFIGAFVYHLSVLKSSSLKSFCNTPVFWKFTSLDLSLLSLLLFVVVKSPLPIFLAVFVICLIPQSDASLVTKVLRSKTLGWIGIRCYGVYLLHDLVKDRLYKKIIEANNSGALSLSYSQIEAVLLVGTLVLTLILVAISYRFVEAPAIRFGRRLEKRYFGHKRPAQLGTF